jgi:hypothetical protein
LVKVWREEFIQRIRHDELEQYLGFSSHKNIGLVEVVIVVDDDDDDDDGRGDADGAWRVCRRLVDWTSLLLSNSQPHATTHTHLPELGNIRGSTITPTLSLSHVQTYKSYA